MKWRFLVVSSLSWVLFPVPNSAQVIPLRSTQPVNTIRTLAGYAYPQGVGLDSRLAGNRRIPSAQGTARIERQRGTTDIEVEVFGMKPASEFGGDFFNIYPVDCFP